MTSIFRYSKNYGSLTHETRIKDAVTWKISYVFWRPFVPLKYRMKYTDLGVETKIHTELQMFNFHQIFSGLKAAFLTIV